MNTIAASASWSKSPLTWPPLSRLARFLYEFQEQDCGIVGFLVARVGLAQWVAFLHETDLADQLPWAE
jgi:hypothetical protein